MAAAYVDTSALVAVLLGERGGRGMMRRLHEAEALFASGLLEAELRSVFVREQVDPRALVEVLSAIRWVFPDRPLRPEIQAVLQAGFLRGADLWHVACALFLAPEPGSIAFLTLDREQRSVAKRIGFAT